MNRVLLLTTALIGAVLAQPATSALPELIVSSNGSYWQTGTVTKVTSGTASIIVDENNKKQLWEGFGGTFNEMGWDALSVVSSEIPRAMKLLFDANEGANFVSGRIPMGASDYAMSIYSLAETAGDYGMEKFSIARDREKLIPFIKAALQLKPDLYLWGSPWWAPAWMRDNADNMKSDAQTQEAYALYFARFVEEYGKEGMVIKAVHPQNEPGYAQVKWTHQLLIDFMKKYLSQKFAERKVTAEIWCGTMSAEVDTNIAIAVTKDADAMKVVKGFGFQWNTLGAVPTVAVKAHVWQTEHRCGNYDFNAPYWDRSKYNPNKAPNDHGYAEESWQNIRDWILAGVSAYCAWNMVLDTYGKNVLTWHQNALLVVDRSAKTLNITPAYYVFRHFSYYIAVGATRIETNSKEAVAFKNPDGSIVVQTYNKNDAAKKVTIGIGASLYEFDLPAHGWATLCERPVTSVGGSFLSKPQREQNRFTVTNVPQGYRIALSSIESAKYQLLSVSGRVLTTGLVSGGSRDAMIDKRVSSSSVVFVRVEFDGGETLTKRLCAVQ